MVSMLYLNKNFLKITSVFDSMLFAEIIQVSWLSVEWVMWKMQIASDFLYVFFPSRMCLVRMKQEGRSGKYMCRIIVHFMWEDVEQRGRIMGVSECYRILLLENSNEGWVEILSVLEWPCF